ncbi:O-methyltransferase [Nonomuraea sp. SYSU D8015]|uniref:O-methyltransferase n=1 Tax=Nonomuraea sp. SYSU D8015 TaxID=2593644 RepID=UPI00166123C6|nr:class I SAM-dependent methyltransferase [Nonomuraea sp. SYSU D8015]
MNPSLEAYLTDLYERGREHDAPLADRLLRLRNMTPAAAAFVSVLIRVQRSLRVLEIGTSNGYSAIWFADAVRDTAGRLTTVEIDAARVAEARANLAAAGVAGHVDVVHADGGQVLESAADASVDLVVLDAERPAYLGYWPHLLRVLTPGGVIAVDNAVSHREQVAGFLELMAADGGFAVHVHEIGDGVLTAVRLPRS